MTDTATTPATGDASEVIAERHGNVGFLTLNRPRALNALSLQMVRDLHAALAAWQHDPAVQAVAIRGMGKEGPFGSFCAGGDIRFLHRAGTEGDAALEARIGIDGWVYQPGLPDNAVHVRSTAFPAVDAQATAFAGGGAAPKMAWKGWSTPERVRFLNSLPRQLTTAQLADLDAGMALSGQGNSEVLFAWLQLAVANRYDPALPALETFLTGQGRRKFVAPLFASLWAQGDWGQPIARRIYAVSRPLYHAVTRDTVDKTVK